jgi:hypothetical protein
MTLFEFLQKETEKSQDMFEQRMKNGEIENIFTHQYEDEEEQED